MKYKEEEEKEKEKDNGHRVVVICSVSYRCHYT